MITRRVSSRRTVQHRSASRFPFLSALRRGQRRRERHEGVLTAAAVESLEDRTLLSVDALSAGKDAPTDQYVANELVVMLHSEAPLVDVESFLLQTDAAQQLQDLGLDSARTVLEQSDESGWNTLVQLQFAAEIDVSAAVQELIGTDGFAWAAPNFIYSQEARELIPNDPSYGQQYHHALMDNDRTWDVTLGESNIVIAITDDGVDIGHPDLAPNIWTNPGEVAGNGLDDDGNGYVDDVNGWDFSNGDNDPTPSAGNDHGTHVAGIAAAVTNNGVGVAGTAGGATIMPLQFYGGSRPWTSSLVAETFAYAVDNGANIINTSYNIDFFVGDPTFLASLQYVHDSDVLHINSAGNSSMLNPARQVFHQTLLVASTDSGDAKSGFSNYGNGIDLAAPGSGILSTLPGGGYGANSGTSMAAPNAAGVAALIWSANPTWTRDQVAAQLLDGADSIDAQNPSYVGLLGSGRANSFNGLTEQTDPPTIDVAGLPANNSVVPGPVSAAFTVTPDQLLDPATVNDLNNWDFRQSGPDFRFGTADDVVYPISLGSPYMVGTNVIDVLLGQGASGVTAEVEPNNTLAGAQDLEVDGWSLSDNPNIQSATSVPHITINGTGDGTYDYYSFDVTAAGVTGMFDIDGANFDTELFLYASDGTFLAGNDDAGFDPGSTSFLDSFFTYTFNAPGTYILGVAEFPSFGSPGGITGDVPTPGGIYDLHISLEGHATSEITDDGWYRLTVRSGGIQNTFGDPLDGDGDGMGGDDYVLTFSIGVPPVTIEFTRDRISEADGENATLATIRRTVPDNTDPLALTVLNGDPTEVEFLSDGLGVLNEIELNDDLASAQDLDVATWTRSSNPDINNSTTVPHVTITGAGDGTFDYYAFTVDQAGVTGTFDIDGATFDSELFLFASDGTFLAANDNGFQPDSNQDPFLTYTFSSAGTYLLGVGSFDSSGANGGISGAAPPAGETYGLHVSVEGHANVHDDGFMLTIPAGENAVSFLIDAVDDVFLDGDQIVPITVQSTYPDAIGNLTVTDYETLTVKIAKDEIDESAGPNATMLTVTRSNVDTQPSPFYAINGNVIVVTDQNGNQIDTISVPYPGGNRPASELVRDLVVLPDGRLAVFNGTNQVYVSLYSGQSGAWQHFTEPGLSAPADPQAGGIAADDQYIYLTDANTASGPATGIVRFQQIGGGRLRFADTEPNDRLFATSTGSAGALGIIEIDPQNGDILNRFDAPALAGVRDGLAFDGNRLWFIGSEVGTDTIYEMDPDTGIVLQTHNVGGMTGFDGLAALDGRIYLLDSFIENAIVVYNPTTRTVERTLNVPENISGGLTAITGPDALLVTDTFSQEIYEIAIPSPTTSTVTIVRTWTQNLGIGDLGLATVGGNIYVALNTSGDIGIYNRLGGRVGTITVPGSIGMQSLGGDDVPGLVPSAISYRDVAVGPNGNIYGLTESGTSLRVFDSGTQQQVANITLAMAVNAMAVHTDGTIFGVDDAGNAIQFDDRGAVLASMNMGRGALIDIDLADNGQLLLGSASGLLLQTNIALETPTGVLTSGQNAFVSFGAFEGSDPGDLVVTLINSDDTEISIPQTVVLPAGVQSITIPVDALDDFILDGTVTVTVTPAANGYVGVPDSVDVLDSERLELSVIPDSLVEGRRGMAVVSRGNVEGPFTYRNSFRVDGQPNVAIPDLTTITSTATVAGVAATIVDVNVSLDITHPWNADLDVFVIAPWGKRVKLFNDIGLDGDNFSGTILDDEGERRIIDGVPPFTGRWRPAQPLYVFDNHSPNGTWTLEITDDNENHIGTLNSWGLEFTVLGLPPIDVTITSSDTSEVSVPATVRLGPNQAQATFMLDALIDNQLDGPQMVDITATAAGYENPPVDSLIVTDGERPVFTSPETFVLPESLEFRWNKIGQAPLDSVRYELWVADVTRGVSPVIHETMLDQPEFRPSALRDGVYRAWVRAFNSNGDASLWSARLEFTTARIPEKVSLTSPRSTISETLPTFEWTAASSAVRYDLWVTNMTTGANPIIRDMMVMSTAFTPDASDIRGGLSELPVGEYRAWVRGFNIADQTGPWSAAQNFSIVEDVAVPGIAQPIGPEYPVSERRPTFQWKTTKDAYSYELWITNLEDGKRYLAQETVGLASNSFTPSTNLKLGRHRFWVRAINSEGEVGPWSRAVDFSVVDDVPTPATPTIVLPNDLITGSLPLFRWTAVANASHYELQVEKLQVEGNDFRWLQVLQIPATPSTQYQTRQALATSLYRVRVRAFNSEGESSDWSSFVQFLVSQNDAQPSRELLERAASSDTDTDPIERDADDQPLQDDLPGQEPVLIAGERVGDVSNPANPLETSSATARKDDGAERFQTGQKTHSSAAVAERHAATPRLSHQSGLTGPGVDAVMIEWPADAWWDAEQHQSESDVMGVDEFAQVGDRVEPANGSESRMTLLAVALPLAAVRRVRRWHRERRRRTAR